MTETDNTIEYCGLFFVLGELSDSDLPLRVILKKEGDTFSYELWLGCDDEKWAQMSQKKRWNYTYLMCRSELVEEWKWQHQVKGNIELKEKCS